MSEIDWSKAPEGATHWERENYGASAGWMKKDGGEWFFLSSEGCWLKHIISNVSAGRLQNMVPCPDSSPAWSGEGLPPVGTVCLHKNNGLEKMRVFAIDGKWAAVSSEFSRFWCTVNELIPIRTPEQIAADERESAVNGMLCYDALGGSRRGLAEALYDAGYRKQEQPK